jgi:hypothetical protein
MVGERVPTIKCLDALGGKAMPRTTAQRVILELIRNAGEEWVGKSKLAHAFYLAHLYYAEERPGILTDWPIVRLPEGPGIHNSGDLLGGLVHDGHLIVERTHEGPYPESRYRLTEKASALPALPEEARRAVQQAAEYALPLRASELSQITRERSRSWRQGRDGQTLNIYIDLIADDEYEEGEAKLASLEQALAQALEGGHG